MNANIPEPPVRIFLLLRNYLLHGALKRLLSRRPNLLVVGATTREDCPPQAVIDSQCDVFILDFLDVQWLPANLLLNVSHRSMPTCLLIAMDEDFDQFETAVRGGVTGYLVKNATAADVFSAVRATSRGEAICPPKLCAALFQRLSQTAPLNKAPTFAQPPDLTLRQLRLAGLVASGLTNKEIASQLNLSHFTVRNHVHRIMKQFKAGSRSQAVHAIVSRGYRLEKRA